MTWPLNNHGRLARTGLFFTFSVFLLIPFITSSSLAATNYPQNPDYPIKIDRVMMTDLSGHPLNNCQSGERLLMITVALENLSNKILPAAIIIELQDNSGITQFVQWQTMSIGPKATSQMAISFNHSSLQEHGEYTAKVLVWDKVLMPEPLGNAIQAPISCQKE